MTDIIKAARAYFRAYDLAVEASKKSHRDVVKAGPAAEAWDAVSVLAVAAGGALPIEARVASSWGYRSTQARERAAEERAILEKS